MKYSISATKTFIFLIAFILILLIKPYEYSANNFINKKDFISDLHNDVINISEDYGLYGSIMMAQAILESNYGNSTLAKKPNYNLFGIKGNYQNNSVSLLTVEYINGTSYSMISNFRKYPSYKESLTDYARLMKNGIYNNSSYYKGLFKSQSNNYQEALESLKGRYATDPNYITKLNKIITENNLTKLDRETNHINKKIKNIINNKEIYKKTQKRNKILVVPTKIYIVKKGDSLSFISSKFSVSTNKIKKWNKLEKSTLKKGQKIIVSIQGHKQNITSKKENVNYYISEPGDSLKSISRKYFITSEELKKINKLNSNIIYPGQKIYLSTNKRRN